MADLLIFAGYLLLCLLGLLRFPYVRNTGLPPRILAGLLLLKITAGCLMGRYYQFQQNADSWGYHKEALVEYRLLHESPREYMLNLFHSGYEHGYSGILSTRNSFWNDLKNNAVVKFVSVLHVFSGGRYYVNVVLFNMFVLLGLIALFRVFQHAYPGRSLLLLLPVFLLPSPLLFGSLIHKDGLVLALLGFACFLFHRLLHRSGRVWVNLSWLSCCLLFIFFLRNYVVALLMPVLATWFMAHRTGQSALRWSALFFGMLFLVFFFSGRFWPRADFLQYTVQKQHDFMELEKGNTTIPLHALKANPVSFLKNGPEAFVNGMVRPVWGDLALSKALLPFVLEMAACWGIFLLFVFYRRRRTEPLPPFILPLMLFGFFLCLFTGYIVPVLGALVRYRAVYLPFIITPLLMGIRPELPGIFRFIKK